MQGKEKKRLIKEKKRSARMIIRRHGKEKSFSFYVEGFAKSMRSLASREVCEAWLRLGYQNNNKHAYPYGVSKALDCNPLRCEFLLKETKKGQKLP